VIAGLVPFVAVAAVQLARFRRLNGVWLGGRWMRTYRAEPAVHGRGESAAWLVGLCVVAGAGLALLLING
jgi:hypothetical protein